MALCLPPSPHSPGSPVIRVGKTCDSRNVHEKKDDELVKIPDAKKKNATLIKLSQLYLISKTKQLQSWPSILKADNLCMLSGHGHGGQAELALGISPD